MKVIVANWKMNCTQSSASTLLQEINSCLLLSKPSSAQPIRVVFSPPYIHLKLVADYLPILQQTHPNITFLLGAQNCAAYENGPYTGEISALMLKEIGCKYVILGHSERRAYCFESDHLIRDKARQAVKQGIVPIICVGETQAERTNKTYREFLFKQVIKSVPENLRQNVLIAYEPIWAIGTGITLESGKIQEISYLIKSLCPQAKILFGGSVNSQNASQVLTTTSLDGLLVGGASLKADEFVNIITSLPIF